MDDGQMRQLVLSVPLRGPRRSLSLSASEGLRRERGAGDGGGFSRALRRLYLALVSQVVDPFHFPH